MKKTLVILALGALALMAETKSETYMGTLTTQSCQGTCSYATYDSKTDKLIALIDGKSYDIEIKNLSDAKIEVALGHDDVTFEGVLQEGKIIATTVERIPDYKGFLGVKSCVENGAFTDCDLKKYNDGEQVVAVIGGKTYNVNKQNLKQAKLDHAIMSNSVGFFGKLDGNTLKLENMIYEGSEKNFFKGCM